MNYIIPIALPTIITLLTIFINSRKHDLEKYFDSQIEKTKRKILYELVVVILILGSIFFFVPITNPENTLIKKLVYIGFSSFLLVFLTSLLKEIVEAVYWKKGIDVPVYIRWFDEREHWFALVNILLIGLTFIVFNFYINTVYYNVLVESGANGNRLLDLFFFYLKEEMYPDMYMTLIVLMIPLIFYPMFRLFLLQPIDIIKIHRKKEIILSFILENDEKIENLKFVNSSSDYFFCYDKDKKEHLIIYKSSIKRVVVKTAANSVFPTQQENGRIVAS